MEGFEEFRKAARQGIIAAGAEPVLAEDFPALAKSPRTACLDGVTSCDLVVVVLGRRGGWRAPSGKLVVQEEYEEARRRKLPTLAFLQEIEKDKDAQELVNIISDYVEGLFRLVFKTPDELQSGLKEALVPLVNHFARPKGELKMSSEMLLNPYRINSEASLRVLVAPEREEEFIDPVFLESEELKRRIYEIGHSPKVGLFSYEHPKNAEVGVNEIVILQSEERSWREGKDVARLELYTGGVIAIDLNVTGRRRQNQSDDLGGILVVLEDDVISALHKSFSFVDSFFEDRDPYKRHDRVLYNAAISGLGYRNLVKDLPKGSTYSMGIHGDEVIVAFDEPRILTREDLKNPSKEIEATMTLFRRRLKSQ